MLSAGEGCAALDERLDLGMNSWAGLLSFANMRTSADGSPRRRNPLNGGIGCLGWPTTGISSPQIGTS